MTKFQFFRIFGLSGIDSFELMVERVLDQRCMKKKRFSMKYWDVCMKGDQCHYQSRGCSVVENCQTRNRHTPLYERTRVVVRSKEAKLSTSVVLIIDHDHVRWNRRDGCCLLSKRIAMFENYFKFLGWYCVRIDYFRGMITLMPKCCSVLAVTTDCFGESQQRALLLEWFASRDGAMWDIWSGSCALQLLTMTSYKRRRMFVRLVHQLIGLFTIFFRVLYRKT